MSNAPEWLKKKLISNEKLFETKRILSESKVITVCESALCPNINECYSKNFATFLILGRNCTRACSFCSVSKSAGSALDSDEPERIAGAVKRLAIRHAIVTSPTRDDLTDAGAGAYVKTIMALKSCSECLVVEVLIPDFSGRRDLIKMVVDAKPCIFGHNIETVKRLYGIVRADSCYERSLGILRLAKEIAPDLFVKSGIMVGLGENEEEVIETMVDIRDTGCDMLTIGQYLRPGPTNLPVKRFVTPEEFERYRDTGYEIGFENISAGPFVRSSYCAEENYKEAVNERCCVTAYS